MIQSFYVVATSEIAFSYKHYIAICLILASWGLWKWDVLSKVATFMVLLLSTFNQAAFTPVIRRQRIGFEIGSVGIEITIQFYALLLLILFIILNWTFIKRVIKEKSILN